MTRSRTLTLAAAVAAPVLTITAGLAAMPAPPSFAEQSSGDPTIGALVRDELIAAGQLHTAAVVAIDGDDVRFAGFGADEHTRFEIASLTKSMTGLLFQDAIDRGELAADDTVASCIPALAGTEIGDAVLADLATHMSGAPRQIDTPEVTAVLLGNTVLHRNPYIYSTEELLDLAASQPLGERGVFEYSNLGTALVGQAVAHCAGLDFPTLIQTRLFDPLGMTDSSAPLTAADLRSDDVGGYSAQGVAEERWTIGGHAPAGGVRSTAADMTTYVRAIIDGTAPGMGALEPRAVSPTGPIGWFWYTLEIEDQRIAFHNGQSGGFTASMMIDREQGRAAIVLDSTAAVVDGAAYLLLTNGLDR